MGRLEDEYETRCSRVDPLDDETRAWHWLWYMKERHAEDGLKEIFALCQKGPRDNGLKNIWALSKEQVTDRELYELFRSETAGLYVGNLLGAGIIAEDSRLARWYDELTQETALEGIKACRPLRGLPQVDALSRTGAPPAATCEAVAIAAATSWLTFLESYHAVIRLPRVRELREIMPTLHSREREIIASDDFTGYALTDREREDLKRDLDLTVAVASRIR